MGISVQDIIGGSITEGVAKIISLFKVDPSLALQKQTEIQEIQLKMQADAAAAITAAAHDQAEVNKTEAASASTFVAGWRPFIGWVCGSGLALQFIIAPLVTWLAALFNHPVRFPELDGGTLLTLLFGMLGLGGMRTFEKINGVNSGH